MKRWRWLASVAIGAAGWALSSCAPGGFASEQLISSVRILASSANPNAYATPGETITLSVLAVDGRADPTPPMQVYWLALPDGTPFVCEDPPDDAYYACFQKLTGAGAASGGDAGAGKGGGPMLPTGVPLPVPASSTIQFQMPPEVIRSHTNPPGTTVPYGLAILFNFACAGHLEFLPVDPNNINPVTVPIGCFDVNHTQLGPDDYVFGFTRVYAYDPPIPNQNPFIDSIDVEDDQGNSLANGAGGFSVDQCTSGNTATCPHVHIGPVVPSTSWEVNPEALDANGQPLHEEIWADFYSSIGSFTDAARLLYDSKTGSLGGPNKTDNQFISPQTTGAGSIWMVVHDSRGGAAWPAAIPVVVTAH